MPQGWDIRVWVALLCGAMMLCAGGFVLLMLGLRGRRRGSVGAADHPHCRKCDFDLFGLGADSLRCPECGSDLHASKATVWGERRRRPLLALVAAVMLLIGAAGAVGAGRATYRHLAAPANKPLWWLMRDLRAAAANTRWTADRELDRRRRASELTARQARALAMTPLVKLPPAAAPQAPNPWASAAWLPSSCIDVAADLRRAGQLSDAEWEAVCRRIITCDVKVRDPVRHGDPIGFVFRPGWSGVAQTDVTAVECELIAARVDDQPAEVRRTKWTQMNLPNWSVRGGGNHDGPAMLTAAQWQRLPVGRHRLTVVMAAEVRIERRAGAKELSWTGPLEASTTFDVVRAETATVEMVVNDSMRDAVRRCVTPVRDPDGVWGALFLGQNDDAGARAPVDLAFDVILRARGREYPAGSFSTSKNGQTMWMLRRPPEGCEAREVDVVLRPSNAEAAKHVEVRTIWGEEVVFPGVRLAPVRTISPAPTPAPVPLRR